MLPVPSERTIRSEIPAASLDSMTWCEVGHCILPIGTIIEDADRALAMAIAHGDATLIVRARVPDQGEPLGFERVSTSDLRAALS
jgi:hypothetical protein